MSTLQSLQLPSDTNLYALLELQHPATAEDIKTAYRRLALRYHPDKNRTYDSTTRFQQLGFAYAILSDPRRKERYDRTGATDSLFTEHVRDWDSYFRELWSSVVDARSIEEFTAKYRGSEEERVDVIKAYEENKGDMDGILNSVMCSTVDDEDRFRDIISRAINDRGVKTYKKFTTIDHKARERRKRQAEMEAREAEEHARELGLDEKLRNSKGDENALKALIHGNQKNREDKFNAIIENYEGRSSGKGKKGSKGAKKRFDDDDIEMDDAMESNEGPFAKRGDNSKDDENSGNEEAPKKRGRGRPRKPESEKITPKRNVNEDDDNSGSDKDAPKKRGRGRPRKTDAEKAVLKHDDNENDDAAPKKRGRGRPRKIDPEKTTAINAMDAGINENDNADEEYGVEENFRQNRMATENIGTKKSTRAKK